MRRIPQRSRVTVVAVAALTAALALMASGCGGGGGGSTSGGGGTTTATTIGKGEGSLNVIEWPYYTYKSFAQPFEQKTGCIIHRKDAGSSQEMFALMHANGGGGGGQYDLVSASGDASLRLIDAGDVQPIDINQIPSWKDFLPAFKSPPHNTVDGKHYGVSVQWGPNTLIYNTQKVSPAPTGWGAIYSPQYKGKLTVPNNPIQIADAALYLMQTKPSLGIKDPYELTQAQLTAATNLLISQKPLLKRYWNYAADEITVVQERRRVDGRRLAVPDAAASGQQTAGQGDRPAADDRLGRHVDARRKGSASELRVQVDAVRDDAEGRGGAGARLRRDAGQPEGLPVHGQNAEGLVRGLPPERAGVLLQQDQVLEDAGPAVRLDDDADLHGLQRLGSGVGEGDRVTLGG